MQVLLFQAIGLPDGSIVVPASFTSEGVTSPPGEGQADLEVELLADDGASLVRHRVAFASPCAVPTGEGAPRETLPRIAQALIAHHAKACTLRVSQWGRTLYERTVTTPPVIDVAWPTETDLGGTEVKLSWSCNDTGVNGLWQFSNDGQNWTPVSLPQPAGTCTVNLGALPGGNACGLRLLASDGVQTHTIDSKTFALKPRGWVALLLAPPDGMRADVDAVIELVGQGFEIEKQQEDFDNLHWTSSIDGDLGAGHRRRVRLSAGQHQISLSVLGITQSAVSIVIG